MTAATIGVCTDSGARLPAYVAADLGVEVVPLTIAVGDDEYLEGVDLSDDQLERLIDEMPAPFAVTEPSSGQFAAAYDDLVARGCTEILSVHSSRAEGNALGAARLAAHSCVVPVRLVDCATFGLGSAFGFGLGCCAWHAATAVLSGATLDGAVAETEHAATRLLHVCTSGPFVDAEGSPQFRLRTSGEDEPEPSTRTSSLGDAASAIASHLFSRGPVARVGIGVAGPGATTLADAATSAIGMLDPLIDVVRYSIGAASWARRHLPTIGCFSLPHA